MSRVLINHYSIMHGGNDTYSVGGWDATKEHVLTDLLSDKVLKNNLPPEHLAEVQQKLFSLDWKSGVELYNDKNWMRDTITIYEQSSDS